ncbi:MAG: type I methionyl aminopeptidase [Desulfohalobiaceae bacterium]|nr:type I methionyl aminopeptidase [Desulfohalobiaceae bacterium]
MVKIGRNDPCPCGSGKKYKKCCMKAQQESQENLKDLYYKRYKIRLKEEKDLEEIRRAGDLVVRTLDMVADLVRPGVSTDSINQRVHEFTVDHGAVPAPLNYSGFPKSVCISVNEVICHGIPGEYELREGDIVNVDVTSRLNGYYADASKTFKVGQVSDEAAGLVDVAHHCLERGLGQVAPGNTVGDIGWAIQGYAEKRGCSVVREMVGHGVGFEFHEPPQVPHFGEKGNGIILVPGMVFTVEPMINLGGRELKVLEDKWTAVTKDGSLSAQFEKTVAVTTQGCDVLTPWR